MAEFVDRFWMSADGLKLHYRDYPGAGGDGGAGGADAGADAGGYRPPVICLPGLTRNARDFAGLATRIAGEWRVLCPEMRGRGDSDYAKELSSYNPFHYVADVVRLLEDQAISRFVAVGTSLGGLMTMFLAMTAPDRVVGAVINDIGPVLERGGLDRIRDYVGQGRSFPTWMHAARALAEVQRESFPDYRIDDWLEMAKRVMTLTSVGRIVFDYDMNIAEPLLAVSVDAPVPDLWPAIDLLAGKPVVVVRGALSDLFSPATFTEMGRRLPGAELVTVARVGHAPTLDEPEAAAAIDRLLARVDAAG